MVDPGNGQAGKELALDPAAGAEEADLEDRQPLDADGAEKEYLEIRTNAASSEGGVDEKGTRAKLEHTKSYATTASAISAQPEEPAKPKGWYRKLNPLKWGGIPPVPKEREVSREYNASFLSLVYFQWMAPIMSVSNLVFCRREQKLTYICRSVTKDSSSRMIFGQSIRTEGRQF